MKKVRLTRATPLVANAGLTRTTTLERSTPSRSNSKQPAEGARTPSAGSISRGPVKPRKRDTGPSKRVRKLVRNRAQGRCEQGCGHPGTHTHHRRPRALGGSSDAATNLPSNLVLLCAFHHALFDSYREYALAGGWLVK